MHMPTPSQSQMHRHTRRQVMINRPITDAVSEAWLINEGDTEKTFVIKGGVALGSITGPAAKQVRSISRK